MPSPPYLLQPEQTFIAVRLPHAQLHPNVSQQTHSMFQNLLKREINIKAADRAYNLKRPRHSHEIALLFINHIINLLRCNTTMHL